jgi:ATP-dependent exoDNAse (exonuclease V) beta subunit
VAAEQIAVLATDTGRWRLALESAFAALGVPVDVDAQVGLGETAFGQALLGLLRFAWFDGDRADLFRFLRSPFSGVPRATVDYAEGRCAAAARSATTRCRGCSRSSTTLACWRRPTGWPAPATRRPPWATSCAA